MPLSSMATSSCSRHSITSCAARCAVTSSSTRPVCSAQTVDSPATRSATQASSQSVSASPMPNPILTRRRSTTASLIVSRHFPTWAPTGAVTVVTCCRSEENKLASVLSAARPATTIASTLFQTSVVSLTRRPTRSWERFAEQQRVARAPACRSASCVLVLQTVSADPQLNPPSLPTCLRLLIRIRLRTLKTDRCPTAKTACPTHTMLLLEPRNMVPPLPQSMLLVHLSPHLHPLNNQKLVRRQLTVNTRPNLLQPPQPPLCQASVRPLQNNGFHHIIAPLPTTRSSNNNNNNYSSSSNSSRAREAPPHQAVPNNILSRETPSHSLQATILQTMPLSAVSQFSLFSNLLNKLNLLASNILQPQLKHLLLPLHPPHRQARPQHPWAHLQEKLKAATSALVSITSTSSLCLVRVTSVRSCLPKQSSPSNCMPSRF